jgi:hypothetical protein
MILPRTRKRCQEPLLTPSCYEFRSCFYGSRNSGSGVAVVVGTMMVAHFGMKGRPRAVVQVGPAGQTLLSRRAGTRSFDRGETLSQRAAAATVQFLSTGSPGPVTLFH